MLPRPAEFGDRHEDRNEGVADGNQDRCAGKRMAFRIETQQQQKEHAYRHGHIGDRIFQHDSFDRADTGREAKKTDRRDENDEKC